MPAPDRIYAKVHGRKMRFHVGGETGGYPPAFVGGWEEYPHTNAVEYIRADLATPAAMTPEVRALVEAAKPFADIGVGSDPDYQAVVRIDRDAVISLRAALAALRTGGDA